MWCEEEGRSPGEGGCGVSRKGGVQERVGVV